MKNWPKRLAIKEALESKFSRSRHGSVIEQGGRILGRGYNIAKPKCPQKHKYSLHGELAAIKNAGYENCIGATLYVCRITKDKLMNSKPCEMCQLHIKAAGIKRVIYSLDANTWAIYEP
jgi:deoxycytidylate deaminase